MLKTGMNPLKYKIFCKDKYVKRVLKSFGKQKTYTHSKIR